MSELYIAPVNLKIPMGGTRIRDLAEAKRLPRYEKLTIWTLPGWDKCHEYVGIVGLCAARGYCLQPSSKGNIAS